MSQSTDDLSMLTATVVAIAALARIGGALGLPPTGVVTPAPAARCAAGAPLPAPAAALLLALFARARA